MCIRDRTLFLLKANNNEFVPAYSGTGVSREKENGASPFFKYKKDFEGWNKDHFRFYKNVKPGHEGNKLTDKSFTSGTLKSNRVPYSQAFDTVRTKMEDGTVLVERVPKEGLFPQRTEALEALGAESAVHKAYEEATGKKLDRNTYEHLPAAREKEGGSTHQLLRTLPIERDTLEGDLEKALRRIEASETLEGEGWPTDSDPDNSGVLPAGGIDSLRNMMDEATE